MTAFPMEVMLVAPAQQIEIQHTDHDPSPWRCPENQKKPLR
jgi:hypothetical protein